MLIIHTGFLLLIKSAASPFDLTEAKVPKHLKLIKTKKKKRAQNDESLFHVNQKRLCANKYRLDT